MARDVVPLVVDTTRKSHTQNNTYVSISDIKSRRPLPMVPNQGIGNMLSLFPSSPPEDPSEEREVLAELSRTTDPWARKFNKHKHMLEESRIGIIDRYCIDCFPWPQITNLPHRNRTLVIKKTRFI